MASIKIYAIVLKHKTDLVNEMTEKLKNTNIDYEIFEAIYGKDLKEDYYKEGGGWKNVTGEVQSLLAWADKRLFV